MTHDTDKINTDKIDTDKIDTDKIDTDKIDTDKIDTDKIDAGKIDAGKIDAGEIEKDEDPVILYILRAVERGLPVNPRDIAIEIADDRARENSPKDAWRKYLLAVKQQAKNLARQGRISILRRGKPVDPNKMKGLVKFSLPVNDEEA